MTKQTHNLNKRKDAMAFEGIATHQRTINNENFMQVRCEDFFIQAQLFDIDTEKSMAMAGKKIRISIEIIQEGEK